MTASTQTVHEVVAVLIDELGLPQAFNLVDRLKNQTFGNASYNQTISKVHSLLKVKLEVKAVTL